MAGEGPRDPEELEAVALSTNAEIAAGTTVGSVHLTVSDLDRSLRYYREAVPRRTLAAPASASAGWSIEETIPFYRDVLGFGLMAQLGQQAAFFAAGGYHHHLGANTWESAGGAPAPSATTALRHATIVLPDDEERARVRERLEQAGRAPRKSDDGLLVHDPSGNALVVSVAEA